VGILMCVERAEWPDCERSRGGTQCRVRDGCRQEKKESFFFTFISFNENCVLNKLMNHCAITPI
jgi:hypothetical protein